ncbi:ABC transporter ATP-binding protein [Weissella oryzae SG25]|uniref:ABC transporter ATP-binding protein n=1 Tax=Weissella oryzae (strain DSM 25784 / JCM 18191 / LMG 30913 / SG25) TaxID=1329250 RepID=A0A069D0K9_WEIOS|nr:zinc ABC transporter substrate-binding protein [Weissella oryzae]GAK30846.1 ABC transporter ATP-binding protein [Weissella oryzae SG25]
MKKSIKFILPLFIVLGLLAIIMYKGISQNTSKVVTNNKIQLVSSLDFYGEMAKAVAGDQAEVHSIVKDTSVDPHDYEPTSDVAKLYSSANLIVSNGGGYDTWSTKFAKQNTKAKSINVASLTNYKEGQNEHLWYKLETPSKLVNELSDELTELKPAKKEYFKKNAQNYLTSLKPLTDLQNEAKTALKDKKYLATEPVYDNTLQALGAESLSMSFEQAVDEGDDPTAKDITDWHNDIDNGSVQFVINNPQNTSTLAKQAVQYAKEHKVPVINVTETKPKGQNYKDWQIDQLKQVLKAVK